MSDERRGRPGRLRLRPPHSSIVAVALLLAGCATPLRPSGGPEDQTPPSLVASAPAAGAVRVADPRVVLTFSERVDEASARRALSVAPAPALPPDVRVRGRDLEVTLGDSLRRDVTYVVTLGTDLRDMHGVALGAPLTLAFATGDRIDQGRIAGTMRNAASGDPVAGAAVLAYRLPADTAASLPDPRVATADYRTQSASDGTFTLAYLRAGAYFVVGLDDRNRDGLAGPAEAFAAPAVRAVTVTDTASAPPRVALWITRADTTAPSLRSAGIRAGAVVARFDEPVQLSPGAAETFAVEDSITASPVAVEAAWTPEAGAREVILSLTAPATPRHRVVLRTGGAVTDTAGNAAAAGAVALSGTAATADTARVRFAAFLPEARVAPDSAYTLRPGEHAAVRFSGVTDSVQAARQIAVRDTAGRALPFRLPAESPVVLRVVAEAPDFIVSVPDSTNRRRFRRPGPDELGAIVGRVAGDSSVVVEAFAAGDTDLPYRARPGVGGEFSIPGLLPGAYRIRLIVDADGDGEWDGGLLTPFRPPEAIGWMAESVRVRARWETDLGTMRIDAGVATAEGASQE